MTLAMPAENQNMRFYSFLIFFFFLFNHSSAEMVRGYYLTANNDTVSTRIDVPRAFLRGGTVTEFYYRITAFDSYGKKSKFSADNINGFGFVYNGKNYTFRSKPNEKGNYYFQQLIAGGSHANLYRYVQLVEFSDALRELVFYTVQKGDSVNLYLKEFDGKKKIKSDLIEFYRDQPMFDQLVSGRFERRGNILTDLKFVVDVLNK